MAARLRIAVICNNHFSKGGGSANSRVIGSGAFVNQARVAFIVTPDDDDDTRMLLIPSKMNIAPIRHGLAYRIEGCMVEFEGTEILTSRVMYESTPITVTADQALAALDGNGEAKSAKAEASEFLQDVRARQWTDVRQGRQAGGRRSGHLGEVIAHRQRGAWHQTSQDRL